MDRGAWLALVQRVTKNLTQLSTDTTHVALILHKSYIIFTQMLS